ncbi:MAG: hypothetical protein QNJ78_05170 [Gammaproteobacteria bacterium]|nr:hypothetical protein [Gammaproteobacteria bacterium]
MKEGDAPALNAFETKQVTVKYSREYMKKHGGVLRICKSEGTSRQEVRTYVTLERSVYSGILEGVGDAATAAREPLPRVSDSISKDIYEAGYYAAYGVVFGATTVARLIPLPNPLAHGVRDGAQAAMGSKVPAMTLITSGNIQPSPKRLTPPDPAGKGPNWGARPAKDGI